MSYPREKNRIQHPCKTNKNTMIQKISVSICVPATHKKILMFKISEYKTMSTVFFWICLYFGDRLIFKHQVA